MNFKIFISLLLGISVLFSCKSKKIVYSPKKKTNTTYKTTPKKPTNTPKTVKKQPASTKKSAPKFGTYSDKVTNYVNLYSEIAMKQMLEYKIPASITLAQGILESGAGTGDLTRRANNHFGIKCHDWKGAKVYHDDDRAQECFRKYSTADFSFQDHSLFLTNRKRYLGLFKLANDDYKGWAKGLQKAGYATDPKYPAKLIGLIERYKLYNYDAKVLGKSEKDAKKVLGKSDQYTVKKGDTLYSIARKHKISVAELKEYNGIEDNTIHQGQTLYVKPLPKDF
ncbi:glucosaminidase domain-containing protein [Aquimarina agarivorans]|uniref:glucosaminidase domain-containing protein n=1 Tax=Aquimarina agarivorans TaxID=980584 RepID=UPI000248F313|nr:glucosaminidase domain-containing protein [Aquimarina agarivorans]